MRTVSVVIALLLLPLMGCYNLVVVSIGSKTAASTGGMLAPEVQCASLAQPGITSQFGDIEAMKVCEAAVADQKKIDKAEKR